MNQRSIPNHIGGAFRAILLEIGPQDPARASKIARSRPPRRSLKEVLRPFCRDLVVCSVSVSLACLPLTLAAQVPPAQDEARQQAYEEAAARLDQWRGLAVDLRSTIDRTWFDTDAVIDEVGIDAESLTRWVQAHIAFEPYAGLLRGAQGTLMSRAGNALDQSVLLATMLADAGYDVRIHHARLALDQARAVLAAIPHQPAEQTAFRDQNGAERLLVAMQSLADEQTVEDPAWLRELTHSLPHPDPYGRAAEEAAFVVSTLEQAGVRLGNAEADRAAVIDEATEYFWVDFRLDPVDPWQAAHPVTGLDDEALATLEPGRTFDDAIPEDWQHRVRIEAFVSQRIGRETLIHPIMNPWDQPAATVHARPLSLALLPANLADAEDGESIEAIASTANIFFPVFDGALAAGAHAFTLQGHAAPPDVLASPAADVVASTAERAGAGLGELSSIGSRQSESSAPELTAAWLDIEIRAPDGATTRVRRDLMDLDALREAYQDHAEPDQALALERFDRLTASLDFMVVTGELPQALLLDRLIEGMLESLPGLEQTLQVGMLECEQTDRLNELTHPRLAGWASLAGLVTLMNTGPGTGQEIRTYRPAPGLVMQRTTLGVAGNPQETIDIVFNPRQSLASSDHGLETSPLATLHHGVWESVVERLHVPRYGHLGAETRVHHSGDVFDFARSGGSVRVIRPDDRSMLDQLPLDERAVGHLRADLDAGYVVIVPAEAIEPGANSGWWRIQPESGLALAMTPDGLGGSTLEYITKTAGLVSGGLGAFFCARGYSPSVMVGQGHRPTYLACCFGLGALFLLAGAYVNAVMMEVGTTMGAGTASIVGASAGTRLMMIKSRVLLGVVDVITCEFAG